MPTYDLAITVTGHDKASNVFKPVESAMRRILEVAGGILASRLIIGIGDQLLQLAGNAIQATAEIQLMRVSLESLAGRELVRASDGMRTLSDVEVQAGQMAKGMMEELAKIAILSPYTLQAVQNTFRLNTAFGYTFEQAKRMTEGLLKMASGIGAPNEQLERMAYNLAQIRLQGKVTALDVRQLALAGIDLEDVLKYVSKQFGYNIKDHLEFNKLVKDGTITWEQFSEKFAEYADKYFGKASEKMARTLIGLKSTFSDVFALTMPRVIGPSVEKVTDILGKLLNLFIRIRETNILDLIGQSWSASLGKVLDPINKLMDGLQSYVDLWLTAKGFIKGGMNLNAAREELNSMQAPLEMVKSTIITVFGAKMGVIINKGLDVILEGVRRIKLAFADIMKGDILGAAKDLGAPKPLLDFIQSIIDGITNLKKFWDIYGPSIKSIFGELAQGILDFAGLNVGNALEGTGGLFERLTQKILDNGPQIVQWFRDVKDTILNQVLPAVQKFIDKVVNEWLPKVVEFATYIKDNWQPILETIGKVILTVVAAFAYFKVLGFLIPLIMNIILFISVLVAQIAAAGGATAFFAAFGAVITAILPVLLVFVGIALAITAVIGLLALGAYLIWKNWSKLAPTFQAIGDTMKTALGPVFTELGNALGPLGAAFGELWIALQPIVQLLWSVLKPVLIVIASIIGVMLIQAIAFLVGFLTGLAKALTGLIEMVTNIIDSLAMIITGIVNLISGLWNMIIGLFTGNSAKVKTGWNQFLSGLVQILGGATMLFQSIIWGVLNIIVQFFVGFAIGAGSVWNAFWASVAANTTGAMNRLSTFMSGNFRSMLSNILSISNGFRNIGQNLVDSIRNGIAGGWGGLISWLQGRIAALIAAARAALKIKSPSKPFVDMGKQITAGVKMGVSGLPRVLDSFIINPLASLPMRTSISNDNHAAAYYAPIYQQFTLGGDRMSAMRAD